MYGIELDTEEKARCWDEMISMLEELGKKDDVKAKTVVSIVSTLIRAAMLVVKMELDKR